MSVLTIITSSVAAATSSSSPLATPGSFTCTAQTNTAASFSWIDIANESSYQLEIASDSGFTTIVQTLTPAANATSITVSGLVAGATYYARLKAVGDGSVYTDSDYTSTVTFTTTSSLYEAEAQAYFDAVAAVPGSVAITTTQKQRYNDWVAAKKAAGTYSSYIAVFPMYGGIAAAHAINAIDLTTGTFMGTWIHSTSGITPNGSNAYFKTGINPKQKLGTAHTLTVGIYSRSDVQNGLMVDIGCEETAVQSQVALYNGELPVGQSGGICNYSYHAAEGGFNSSLGYAVLTRSAENSLRSYRGGALLATNNSINSTNLPDKEVYVGAYNNNGTAANFSTRQLCWVEIAGIGVDDNTVHNDNIFIEGIQDAFVRGVQ